MGDGDPTLSEQVLDVSKADCEPQIQPNGVLDDGRWEPITAIAQCSHRRTLPAVRCQDHGSSPDVTNPSIRLSPPLAQAADGWRVVDILGDGTISRVATQRSDFRSTVLHDGGSALVVSLQRKISELSGGSLT